MKKHIFYTLLILTLINCVSCVLLSDIYDISSSRDENDNNYRIKVDIENKTYETIIVNLIRNEGMDNEREITLTTIPKEKIKTINITKGSTITVTGGNSQRKYLTTVCETDFERIVVW